MNNQRMASSVDEAVDILMDELSDEDKAKLVDANGFARHFGYGLFIRNRFKLWQGAISKGFPNDADTISEIIVSHLVARITGKPIEPDPEEDDYEIDEEEQDELERPLGLEPGSAGDKKDGDI